MGKPEVIGSSVALVPRNALVHEGVVPGWSANQKLSRNWLVGHARQRHLPEHRYGPERDFWTMTRNAISMTVCHLDSH
jgi:hypothetical protein